MKCLANISLGSGSILEALNFDAAIIAVPNPTLMGNHQAEIAKDMDKKGFLTHGKLGYVFLPIRSVSTPTIYRYTLTYPPFQLASRNYHGGTSQ